jgi:predicted DNA-binding transcriptional regulator AlpA
MLPINPRVLSEREAAKYVGLSVHTLRNYRTGEDGRAPRWYRNGKKILYDIADLDAYLDRLRDEVGQ